MFDIPPQPWADSRRDGEEETVVASVPADRPRRRAMPKVFGRAVMPKAEVRLRKIHRTGALRLTRVEDVILLPGNTVLDPRQSRLLPQTFLRRGMKQHGQLFQNAEAGTYSLRPHDEWAAPRVEDRALFLADTDYPDTYGHWLVDTMPMLWALRHAPADILVATSIAPTPNILAMFDALGVPASRLVHITGPTLAREVYVPDVALHRRQWMHSEAEAIFARLARLGDQSKIARHDRIYVSRSRVAKRRMVNEKRVEKLFAAAGFFILHPQEHPIADQVALFAHAKMIAGAGGSAMHNIVFAPPATPVLIICSESWRSNADIVLCPQPGRLAYVFGEILNQRKLGPRSDEKWQVNLDLVRMAVEKHLGARRSPASKLVVRIKRLLRRIIRPLRK